MQLFTNFTYLFFSFIIIAAAHAENSDSAIIPEYIVKRDAADPAPAAAAAGAGNANAAAGAGNANAAAGAGNANAAAGAGNANAAAGAGNANAAAGAGNGNAAAGNGNAALGGGAGAAAAGGDATTETDSATTAWLTLTTKGVVTTVATKFHQSFFSSHTTADASIPAGSIGLGSHSGVVGVIKSQNIVTVSSSGAADMMNGQFLDNKGGMCACLLAVIGAFIV